MNAITGQIEKISAVKKLYLILTDLKKFNLK